jgi:hypothetical protein
MTFKKFRKNHSSVFERRVLKGIPDSCRSRAWHLIVDPKAEGHPRRPSVNSFFEKVVPAINDVIERDIPRTMPGVSMFTQDAARESLYRILRAYCNADPEFGYFQGEAFYAALFLVYMSEARAFWTFYYLMQGKRHMLRTMFMHEFDGLKRINIVWKHIFEKRYPKVYKAVTDMGCDPMIYTPSWFLTAFLNLDFPPVFRLRIMDRYLAFGMRAILSLGLAVISLLKNQLVGAGLELVIPLMQNPCRGERLKDWRNIIPKWDKLFISKSQYTRLFAKLGVVPLP